MMIDNDDMQDIIHTVEFSPKEKELIERYSRLTGMRVSEIIRRFTIERVEEEMEAEPTFYRYDMDDLPEDTPQEVLDYIAELEMEDENIAD